jgi:hypothetical protein
MEFFSRNSLRVEDSQHSETGCFMMMGLVFAPRNPLLLQQQIALGLMILMMMTTTMGRPKKWVQEEEEELEDL